MRTANDDIQIYVESLMASPSPALTEIANRLQADGKWGINIGAVEARLMQFFIRAFKVKKILEVGTQYGYSTQWMVEALPADGSIVTLEKDEAHHQMARQLVTDPRVEFVLGDATETMAAQASKAPFDLIFIDANKKAYPEYLSLADGLLAPGGILVGDNTFLFGTVLNSEPPPNKSSSQWQAMRNFNKAIFDKEGYVSCIVPTGEGMTVAFKK